MKDVDDIGLVHRSRLSAARGAKVALAKARVSGNTTSVKKVWQTETCEITTKSEAHEIDLQAGCVHGTQLVDARLTDPDPATTSAHRPARLVDTPFSGLSLRSNPHVAN